MVPARICIVRVVALIVLLTLPYSGHAQGNPKRKLVWSEEFNRPGRPDPSKWDYEVGFVRNKELQYYTRDRRENANVEGAI